GAKGYSLAPDALPLEPFEREAAGQPEALVRLQRWVAGAEEELTASVEVRDPVAYLDYPLYWRYTPDDPPPPGDAPPDAETGGDRFGLLALLLSCGYNPTVLDLSTIGDSALAELPVAVFPSRDFLRLDDYGKLVVFTLRGGALVTFPQPATREVDGTPLNTRFLWPHRPVPPSFGSTLRAALRVPFGSGLRPALRDPLSGERLPAEVARALPGPWRTFPDAARPFVRYGRSGRGEVPRAAPEAVQAQVLLTAGGAPLAYRVQVRSGTSAVLGVPLGAPYSAPAYATHPPPVRRVLRRLVLRLFEEGAPRQIVPDESLEVEAVARLSPDGGCLLFVLNRLEAPQAGRLRFPHPGALNLGAEVRAEVLYSATGSGAVGETGGVRLDLAPGEALVLRLT
ncbi:MAG TPA: hypothetical protein VHQ00_09630, partial [Chloroflexota bacterium]|nr:hypothetical protein [Chloroflexota bacterium]